MSASEPVSAARRQALEQWKQAKPITAERLAELREMAENNDGSFETHATPREVVALCHLAEAHAELRDAAPSPAALPTQSVLTDEDRAQLREYVEASGGQHDEGCPEDDTCDCSWAPILATVNRLCKPAAPSRPSTTTVSINPSHRSHTTTTPSTTPPASSGALMLGDAAFAEAVANPPAPNEHLMRVAAHCFKHGKDKECPSCKYERERAEEEARDAYLDRAHGR